MAGKRLNSVHSKTAVKQSGLKRLLGTSSLVAVCLAMTAQPATAEAPARMSAEDLGRIGALRGVNLPNVVAGNAGLEASLAAPAQTVLRALDGGLMEGVDGSGFDENGNLISVVDGDGNRYAIRQTEDLAAVDWSNFDIAGGDKLVFDQPGSEAIILNRIFDGKPSQIAGAIEARGQVWLTNANGVYFHEGARVDVGSLLASTLTITEEQFEQGLLQRVESVWDDGLASVAAPLTTLDYVHAPADVEAVAEIRDATLSDLAGFIVRRKVLLEDGAAADDPAAQLPELSSRYSQQLPFQLAPYDLPGLYEAFADGFDTGRLGSVDPAVWRNAADPESLIPADLRNALVDELRTFTERRVVDFRDTVAAEFQSYIERSVVLVEKGARINASAAFDDSGLLLDGEVGDPGKVMLFAPNVANYGALSAADGQVILGAGEDVYLGASSDPALRGLYVEVSGRAPGEEDSFGGYNIFDFSTGVNFTERYLQERAEDIGMAALNFGDISTPRGNITMVGAEVYNAGRLSAETSIRRNGSVHLRATHGVAPTLTAGDIRMFGGEVRLEEGSVVEIDVPRTDETDISAQVDQLRQDGAFASEVLINARDIVIGADAAIRAPGGDVLLRVDGRGSGGDFIETLVATSRVAGNTERLENYLNRINAGGRGQESSITIRSGAVIDVSGLEDVRLDMASNVIDVEVRSPELSQSPRQRGGLLDGETLQVDIREGTGVVNWVGALDAREVTAAQESVSGGTVDIRSLREVVIEEGAVIDISGGYRRYEAGTLITTRLVTQDGQLVNIAEANRDVIYADFAPESRQFQASYFEGGDAGALTIFSPGGRYFGELRGDVAVGSRQRLASVEPQGPRVPEGVLQPQFLGGRVPEGGVFTFASNEATLTRFNTDRLFITNGSDPFTFEDEDGAIYMIDPEADTPVVDLVIPPATEGDAPTVIERFQSVMSDDFIDGAGLGEANIFVIVSGNATAGPARDLLVLAPETNIEVGPGGALNLNYVGSGLRGFIIGENSRLSAPGGVLSVQNAVLASGVELSARGQWINDGVGADLLLYGVIDGGVVDADGAAINGPVTIDVTGGGWRRRTGAARSDGSTDFVVEQGRGGSVSLIGRTPNADGLDPYELANITFLSGGLAGGGELAVELAGDEIRIVAEAAPLPEERPQGDAPAVFELDDDFFRLAGFADYELFGNDITVADGAVLAPQASRLEIEPTLLADFASGGDIYEITQTVLPTELVRIENGLSAGVALEAAGRLVLEQGSIIDAGINGRIRLRAGTDDLSAPAIEAAGLVQAVSGEINIDAVRGRVWVHDSARILAPGASFVRRVVTGSGRSFRDGVVLDGGAVSIGGVNLVTEAGSLIDVSGAQAELDIRQPFYSGVTFRLPQTVASEGGEIFLGGIRGGYVLGDLRLHPGAPFVRGGALTLTGGADGVVFSEEDAANSAYGQTLFFIHFDLAPFAPTVPELVQLLIDFGFFPPEEIALLGLDSLDLSQLEPIPFGSLPFADFQQFVFDTLGVGGGGGAFGGVVVTEDTPAGAAGLDPSQIFGVAGPLVPPDSYTVQTTSENFTFTLDLFNRIIELFSGESAPAPEPAGLFRVPVDLLAQSRADNLLFNGRLIGEGNVTLTARNSIDIFSDAIAGNGDVTVQAPYVRLGLGGADSSMADAVIRESNGDFAVIADQVDITGLFSVNGFQQAKIDASGSIRGYDPRTLGGTPFPVVLQSDTEITLTAREIFPGTDSEFILRSDERITIEGNGPSAAPLSADGALRVEAPQIVQNGVLRAPFGEISLIGDAITLGENSVTSVTSDGQTILYGLTRGGTIYEEGRLAPPDKRILIDGAVVIAEEGSVIDVSGGGDTLALEFVAGPLGQVNILDGAEVYAIAPTGAQGLYAPVDPRYVENQFGDPFLGGQVALSAGFGVPAGAYTLLPAEYALLPGAYRIIAEPGTQDFSPVQNRQLADGSFLLSGRFVDQNVFAEGGRQVGDARLQAFRVLSGEGVREQSEFIETSSNVFFSGGTFAADALREGAANINLTPRRPVDGGLLTLAATEELALEGDVFSAGVDGARGGLVDFAAPQIAVVAPGTDLAGLDGYLLLDTETLNGIGAESLLIGGRREQTEEGFEIVLDPAQGGSIPRGARDVVVRTNTDNPLAAPEVLLVAIDDLTVEEGSVVRAEGGAAPSGTKLIIGQSSFRNESAFLRLSSLDDVEISRAGTTGSNRGNLTVEADAVLDGGRSLAINATGDISFDDTASISGATVSAAASRVVFGDAPPGASGLLLGEAALAALTQTENLRLTAFERIVFYGDVQTSFAGAVQLDAPLFETPDDATVLFETPGTLRLSNSGDPAGETLTQGAGVFRFVGGGVALGEGDKAFSGFDLVDLGGAGRFVTDGDGMLRTPGDLTARAAEFAALGGAQQTVEADGDINLLSSDDAAALDPLGEVGGRFAFNGENVTLDTVMRLPSGVIELNARTGDVLVGGNAVIDATGGLAQFFEREQTLQAGRVILDASQGRIALADGSLADVSGDAAGGDAGLLSLTAASGLALDGELRGGAADGARGGQVAINVTALDDFGAVNSVLNGGGFSGGRSYVVAAGDVEITGETRADEFILSTAEGVVTLAEGASIIAAGADGGEITLAGGGGLIVEAGALLDAGAAGENGDGGTVRLLIGDNAQPMIVENGAAINVASSDGGEAGVVRLRAPQLNGFTDVAVDSFGADVSGGPVILEAFRRYDLDASGGEAVIDAPLIGATGADAAAFMANAGGIAARLGQSGNDAFLVKPGIEITSAGDLALADDWNLSTARYGDAPGNLTLRAAGDLTFRANLSDGFDVATRNAPNGDQASLTNDASWSYVLVAGGQLDAADPATTRAIGALDAEGLGGSVIVGLTAENDGALVRTGAGNITVAAGRDLELSDDGSVIYTAGVEAAAVDGFVTPLAAVDRAGISPDGSAVTQPAPPLYPENAGDIRIDVGGDIRAAATPINWRSWLWRQGTLSTRPQRGISPGPSIFGADAPFFINGQFGSQQTSLWVRYDRFRMGLASLGGDIDISAGGDIDGLNVSLPRTVRVSGGLAAGEEKTVHYTGGGDLTVSAGGDIIGGSYYVSTGAGAITAGGAVRGPGAAGQSNDRRAPWFALGDAVLSVTSIGDLAIAGINSITNVDRITSFGVGGSLGSTSLRDVNWLEYDENSALQLTSLGGDIILRSRDNASGNDGALVAPSQVRVVAANGSIDLSADFVWFDGTENAELEFLARDNVFISGVYQSDADFNLISRVVNPAGETFAISPLFAPNRFLISRIITGGVLQGNDGVNRIYAADGDVFADMELSMQSRIRAGGDFRSAEMYIQNNNPFDLTLIEAENIYMNPSSSGFIPEATPTIFAGPGQFQVIARRELQPGQISIQGPQTPDFVSGEIQDPSLVGLATGDLTLMAGIEQTPEYDAFISAYIDPENVDAMPGYLVMQADDGARRPIYLSRVGDWTREFLGDDSLSDVDAFARWQEIDIDLRRALIFDILYAEVKVAGREAVASSPQTDPFLDRDGDPTRGYDAIGVLFPGAQRAPDEALAEGEIRWEGAIVPGRTDNVNNPATASAYAFGSGDISILAPGGQVELVSLAASSTNPANQGVVTRRGGDISVITGRDYIVNQSRTLTADGGDLLIWASYGDIDAGRGVKTSLSVPPVIYPTDEFLNTRAEIAGIASGAGIATLDRVDGSPGGDVDLYAFNGVVNAGEAGIRASQDLFIGAIQILGLDNITVGGSTNVDLGLEAEAEIGPLNFEDFAQGAVDRALDDALEALAEADALRGETTRVVTATVLSLEDEEADECPEDGSSDNEACEALNE